MSYKREIRYKKEILIETFKFDKELLSGILVGGGNMMYFNSSLVVNITRQQYDEKDFKNTFKVHKNRFRG